MKIKTIKDIKIGNINLSKDSVIELDAVDGFKENEDYIPYTEEVIKSEKADIEKKVEELNMSNEVKVEKVEKTVEVENKGINIVTSDKPKVKFVKALKALKNKEIDSISFETKAASGQNEGTAGDGGNLVVYGMDELQGILEFGSVIAPKCRQREVGRGEWGLGIPYRNESAVSTSSAPRSYEPGEGVEKTYTKVNIGKHECRLGLDSILLAITEELMEDADGFVDVIEAGSQGKLNWKADYNILKGAYSAGVQGCIGVFDAGAASFYVEPVAHNATYTATILRGIESGIDPVLRPGAEWYMSNSVRTTLLGQLGHGTATQPVWTDNYTKLLGYPVNVLSQMSAFGVAGDILLANFAKGYTFGKKGGITLTRSDHVLFTTDEIAIRLVYRYCGAPTYREYAPIDSLTVAAFSSTSGT